MRRVRGQGPRGEREREAEATNGSSQCSHLGDRPQARDLQDIHGTRVLCKIYICKINSFLFHLSLGFFLVVLNNELEEMLQSGTAPSPLTWLVFILLEIKFLKRVKGEMAGFGNNG